MQQTQAQDPVRWEAYDPDGYYCEMQGRGADAGVALIRERIAGMSMAELQRRAELAERELFNLGITFTIYSELDASLDRARSSGSSATRSASCAGRRRRSRRSGGAVALVATSR